MIVERLELHDFRNYCSATLQLERGITAVVGDNGQGKTNLAEALAYLATLDSFRGVPPEALVRVGAEQAIIRAEVEHDTTPSGSIRTTLAPLQALRGLLPSFYPRVIEVLQMIGAGGLLMAPTAADFNVPGIAKDVAKYYQGAEGLPSVDRVRLFKLAWDLAGDAFGSRQLQYERFYAGDPVRILAMTYLGSSDKPYRAMVDAINDNNLAAATAAHRALEPLVRATMTHVPGTVATKYILHGLGRISSPRVRLPLVGPEESEAALIEDEIALVDHVPGVDFTNFRPDRNAAAGGALPKVAGTTR